MQRPATAPATAALLLCNLALAPSAEAFLMQAQYADQGGFFDYRITVINDDPIDELLSVTIEDAPMGDGLITSSLTAPAGFLGSYGPGLGFIDLAVDNPGFFPVGSTGPFTFSSLTGPTAGFISAYSTLDLNGSMTQGSISQVQAVPTPPALALLGLGLGLIVTRRRPGREPRLSAIDSTR